VKASATYKTALRMLPYIRWRAARQLCCLLLTVAVISIPLNGISASRASGLIPLKTIFVPFDTSIQSPGLTLVEFSVGTPSGSRIVMASNAISFPVPHLRDFARYLEPGRRGVAGAVVLVTARSPPLA